MITSSESGTAAPAPGFADPTREAQSVFRAILDALAHPGQRYSIQGPAKAPASLGPGLAAVAMTILDEQSPVALHEALAHDASAVHYLSFHTGARLATSIGAADFVFATPDSFPDLEALAHGSDEAPHRSATIILDARARGEGDRFTGVGPGIDGIVEIDAPWVPTGFADVWAKNASLFPRGVDLLVVDDNSVVALPRTTRPIAASIPGSEA